MTNSKSNPPAKREEPAAKAAPKPPERVNVKIRTYPGPHGRDVAVVGGLFLWDPQLHTTTINGQPTAHTLAPKLSPGQVISVPRDVAEIWLKDKVLRRQIEITYEEPTRPVVFHSAQEAKAMTPGKGFGRTPEGRRLQGEVARKLAAGEYDEWPTPDNPNTVVGLAEPARPVTGWADAQRG